LGLITFVRQFLSFPRDADETDNGANLVIWSAVEPGLGIIAGSIATLRPLLRHITDHTSSTNTTLVSSNATEPKASKFEMKNFNNNIRFPLENGKKNALLETSDETDGTAGLGDNRGASVLKGKARNNGYNNDLEAGSGDVHTPAVLRREEQLARKKKEQKKVPKQREGMPLGIFTTRASDGGDSDSDSDSGRGVRTGWYSHEKLTEPEP
jgi:hypothetical protein